MPKGKPPRLFDISDFQMTWHAGQEFINDCGITDIEEGNRRLQIILKNAQLIRRRQYKGKYASQGWTIITEERGKHPKVITMYLKRRKRKQS